MNLNPRALGIALLLSAATLASMPVATAQAPATTSQVRLGAYNVLFGIWAEPERIAEMFRPYDLDIIGFSEVPDGDWTARVGSVLGMPYAYVGKISSANHKDKYKSILSKTPLTGTREIAIEATGWSPASVVGAETVVRGVPILAYSTHIPGSGKLEGSAAEVVANSIIPNATAPNLVIFGDLNNVPGDETLKQIEAGGMRSAWADLALDTTRLSSHTHIETGTESGVIDHIYFKTASGAKALDGGIIYNAFNPPGEQRVIPDYQAQWQQSGKPLSDHRPVWAVLAFPRTPGITDAASASSAVALGSRRELFVDRELVGSLEGAELRLQHPHRAGTAFDFDQPWEGAFSAYPTVIEDGGNYHMYYRGMPRASHDLDTEVTCYAASNDGIHWQKPQLGLFEVGGTKQNNVILARSPACHNFAPFLDRNPAAPADQRFKALGGTDELGLSAFVSADGVHWRPLRETPVFVDQFEPGWAFDSQNVCFWSEAEGRYVLYYRRFIDGLRKIYRVSSPDLLDWGEPADSHANLPGEHLYTNQTQPYFRAPHLYVAFPKRFFPGKVSVAPEVAAELVDDPDYRKDTADAVFMTSRSGRDFDRTFKEGFIRPGPSPRDWISRSNAPACGVVPAVGEPRTMYLYRLSHYGQPTTHMTRYELRTDGFASLSAGAAGGELVTRPVTFSGSEMHLNFSTSAGGSIRVEIQDTNGRALPGFALSDCLETIGDELDRKVEWQANPDLAALAGTPVQLRIALTDADLFSLQFR